MTNYSNKENYSKFGMINTGQDIESEDKVVIVTTCLPFIIEFKSNSDDKHKTVLKEDKVINIILYKIKEMDFCKIYWVGMLPGFNEYSEELKIKISEFLFKKNIIVIFPKKNEFLNFNIYVNKIIYPMYNNCSINIIQEFINEKEIYYKGYSNINKIFADTLINFPYKNPKMILINDIDLALVPNYFYQEINNYKNLI